MDTFKDIAARFAVLNTSTLKGCSEEVYAVVDPQDLELKLESGASAHLLLVHEKPIETSLKIELEDGAHLSIIELYCGETKCRAEIRQAANSECEMTHLAFCGAKCDYTTELLGGHASSKLQGLFLVGTSDDYTMNLRTNHRVSDCTSDSTLKGVAGGEGCGQFYGLVYVAQDAQRTDAQQQSRNILLSEEARIDTKPQLEIYADDVKCTHGATVGQMDDQAIYYMRQRGLSLSQARQLQIEGFASDVVRHCGMEELYEPLMELIHDKMERM